MLRDHNLAQSTVQFGLGLLHSLDIATDSQGAPFDAVHSIGQIVRFHLSAYDALYLELALRAGCPSATFDKAMIALSPLYGIALLGTT